MFKTHNLQTLLMQHQKPASIIISSNFSTKILQSTRADQ